MHKLRYEREWHLESLNILNNFRIFEIMHGSDIKSMDLINKYKNKKCARLLFEWRIISKTVTNYIDMFPLVYIYLNYHTVLVDLFTIKLWKRELWTLWLYSLAHNGIQFWDETDIALFYKTKTCQLFYCFLSPSF